MNEWKKGGLSGWNGIKISSFSPNKNSRNSISREEFKARNARVQVQRNIAGREKAAYWLTGHEGHKSPIRYLCPNGYPFFRTWVHALWETLFYYIVISGRLSSGQSEQRQCQPQKLNSVPAQNLSRNKIFTLNKYFEEKTHFHYNCKLRRRKEILSAPTVLEEWEFFSQNPYLYDGEMQPARRVHTGANALSLRNNTLPGFLPSFHPPCLSSPQQPPSPDKRNIGKEHNIILSQQSNSGDLNVV